MKKHLVIRVGILLVGFLLIYLYDHWDSWFNNSGSIGGNSGMSIPMEYVLNLGWIALWCLYLFIELLIVFFRAKPDKKKSVCNLILFILGVVLIIAYSKIVIN